MHLQLTQLADDAVFTNLYIITLVILGTVVVKLFTSKIYKVAWIGVLELCFLLNLTVVSTTLHYLMGKNGNNDDIICKTITASIILSFLLYWYILGYHVYLRLAKIKCLARTKDKILRKWHHQVTLKEESNGTDSNPLARAAHTTTHIELRESLLESHEKKI